MTQTLFTITDGTTQDLAFVSAGFLVGLVIIYLGFRKYQTGRLIRNTPTEKTRSVAVGRTEVNGNCREATMTFSNPFSEGRCVYRYWQVEEYKKDHSDDDNTKSWDTVDSGTDTAEFYVEDDTGEILVDATDDPTFQISDENTEQITVSRGASLPNRVASFYESDESARQHQTAELFDAMPDSMFGGAFGPQEVSESTTEEGSPDPAQFYQEYLPEEMLTEDGVPREDLSEEQLETAMRDHAQQRQTTADVRSEQQAGSTGSTTESAHTPDGSTAAGSVSQKPDSSDGSSTFGTVKNLVGSVADTASTLGSMGSKRKPSSRYRRRFTEKVIPVDEEVYVFGGAYQRDSARGSNAERLVIQTDAGTDRFIVSDRDETSLARHYTLWAPLYMLGGLVLSSGTLYLLLNDWVLV